MADIKASVDESTYLLGASLSEAIQKFANRDSLQRYLALTNAPPNTKSISGNKPFAHALQSITENLQKSNINQKKISTALNELRTEVLNLIKGSFLLSYGYLSPRKMSDMPVKIPVDMMMQGNINWEKSELIYKDFEFLGVRLIEKDADTAENKNEFSEPAQNFPQPLEKLNPELHVDEKRAAAYLGISHRTLQGYRVKGGGPEFIKIGRKVVRYKIADLIKWAESKKRQNTSCMN